jgi:hypothetical protein
MIQRLTSLSRSPQGRFLLNLPPSGFTLGAVFLLFQVVDGGLEVANARDVLKERIVNHPLRRLQQRAPSFLLVLDCYLHISVYAVAVHRLWADLLDFRILGFRNCPIISTLPP